MSDQGLHEASVRYANSLELAKRANAVLDKDRSGLELEKQRVNSRTDKR